MALIRIEHKNLKGGALLDEREFDPKVHKRFVESAPKSAPKPAPKAETPKSAPKPDAPKTDTE